MLLEETTDPASMGQWQVGLPTRDFAQEAVNKAQDAYRNAWGEAADMDSLIWQVKRRES